ncbi:MAG: hypothetical protein ABI064_03035 [Acidobacteriaceae bacterium]
MGINETREYIFVVKIKLSAPTGSQVQDILVRSDGYKAAVSNSNGLSRGVGWVARPDIPVVQNQRRLFQLQEWRQRHRTCAV